MMCLRFHRILPMAFCLCFLAGVSSAFYLQMRSPKPTLPQQHPSQSRHNIMYAQRKNIGNQTLDRRGFYSASSSLAKGVLFVSTTTTTNPGLTQAAQQSNGLPLTTSSTGLRWADAKIGTGLPLSNGQYASIDYSIASTAGRFPQIYTTKDKGAPYRWKLGDGSTIRGIEYSVLGTADIPPMLPGGVRRVIVPASLGYEQLMRMGGASYAKCIAGEQGSIGPIPPKDDLGAYQRWYSFYCNSRIPYQPDLVLDIKLYGKR